MSADPISHVYDQALFGLDRSGVLRWLFAVDHEAYLEQMAGFQPLTLRLGPLELPLVLTKHMAGVTLMALLLFVVGLLVARAARRSVLRAEGPKGRLQNAVEAVFVYLRDEMIIPQMGPHGAKYMPLFVTYFFLILAGNLFGMLPAVGAPTGNINVTAALASTVFVLVFALGIHEQGPLAFARNVVPHGVPWWLWPFLFAIELLGLAIKCVALTIRLFANMIAGHAVIACFLLLIGMLGSLLVALAAVPLSVAMSLLEILVSFIQAFIFAILATVFIGNAVHPEH